MRRVRIVLLPFAAMLLAASCSKAPSPGDAKPGQESFVSSIPGSSGRDPGGRATDEAAGAPAANGASGTVGAAGGSGSNSAPAPAPSGRTATVEEADIYRVDGNRLFTLNTYRGFMAFDLSDPTHPTQLGRLPIHGYPIEMYVQGTTVYALLREALYLTREPTGVKVTRRNVSQLIAIDVSDLGHPRVVRSHDIVGQLQQGVSRKLGDTLYVVSYVPQYYYWPGSATGKSPTEQAWVYSYNIADPSNPTQIAELKIFEGGAATSSTATSSSGRSFGGIAISATANTLHVVENWYSWSSDWSSPQPTCGYRSESAQQAIVSIIDISDPTGHIRKHSSFTTPGSLNDQFKHTYVYDAATKKGHYLGIFQRQEWSSSGCSWTATTTNTLEAWDITDGEHPSKVSALTFGKDRETVRGSAFDATRKVAYAITARQQDPLYAISFENPAQLKVLSAIDGLSGDMSVFRLIDDGRYLLGVGRDTSATCDGFGSATTGWSSNIAVSVIDVRDLTKTRLVQRKCVTVQDATWVTSQISWNLDQAHKMLGMFSDARANLITVPVTYYSKTDTDDGWYWYRPASAVGMMTYDVSVDDPAKAPTDQAVLRNWGTVVHGGGSINRSILFTHQSSAGPRRMMVNLSDTHLSVVDIEDLSKPVTKSLLEVAPYHQRLYRFGDYAVDEVQLGGGTWWQPGASEFRVKRAVAGLDDAPALATFTVGRVDRVLQWKNLLLLFRPVGDPSSSSWRSSVRSTELVAYDLTTPTQPRRRGSVELDFSLGAAPFFWCGAEAWGYWPLWSWYGNTSVTSAAEGLAVLVYRPQDNGFSQDLVFVDATNPDAIAVSKRELMRATYGANWTPPAIEYLSLLGDQESSSGVVVASRRLVGNEVKPDGTSFTQYKYFAEHYDARLASDWSVNTPGMPLRVYAEGETTRLLSLDTRYASASVGTGTAWRPEQRLHLLTRRGGVARLDDSLSLGDRQLSDMVGDAKRLFLNLTTTSWWGDVTSSGTSGAAGTGSASSAPVTSTNALVAIDLSGDRLDQRFSGALGLVSPQLMGLHGDRLFANLPGDGVLVIDVAALEAPVGVNFLRTLGWATHLAFNEPMVFVAAGNFGVFELDMSQPAMLAAP